MYVESDEDGDGFFETLMLCGESMSDFEQFTRTRDGKIEPISTEEYLDLKEKVTEATQRLHQALKEAKKE